MQPVTSPGKSGAIDNPEVYDNIPGHIIPIIEQEFDDFETEANKFIAGEIPEPEYIGFRLKQGVYGQRQPGVNMTRVKIPFGGITPEQMDSFAEVVETLVPLRKGHITTRQNIQYHHVPLADKHKAMRILAKSGLSSREGCGNTVRNVTGDPYAGILEGEPFDPTPYAGAFVRYFVRNELTQLMPRKIKTAFTSDNTDRALTLIHDLGYIPRVKDGVKGFEIRVGGGTSIMPRLAPTLIDFAPLDKFLMYSEAALRIFNRADELRANRARARIKFLVDRIGIEEFRRLVDEEIKGEWVNERNFDPTPLLYIDDEEATAPGPLENAAQPNGDLEAFNQFTEANVVKQRQAGFSAVAVKITRGDLSPDQFRGLGDIMRKYCGGRARTTVQQNLILRWVRDEAVYEVYQALGELGLNDAGVNQINDVVSCPGTDSCKLGITSSMGLNQAIQERVESLNISDPLTRQIHIKMSGCPNGCSQHHIANIGFHGASMKFGDKTVPAYLAVLGGHYDSGDLRLAQRLKVRLPAKRVPDAVERFLKFYESDRNEGEIFNDFVDRIGPTPFEELVKDLSVAVEFNEDTKDTFIDWNRNQIFVVERGEGECAV